MNEQQLAEIEAREAKATKGPWETVKVSNGETCFPVAYEEDAVFIAHARTDLPALIAEVRRLRKLLRIARAVSGPCPFCLWGQRHNEKCPVFTPSGKFK